MDRGPWILSRLHHIANPTRGPRVHSRVSLSTICMVPCLVSHHRDFVGGRPSSSRVRARGGISPRTDSPQGPKSDGREANFLRLPFGPSPAGVRLGLDKPIGWRLARTCPGLVALVGMKVFVYDVTVLAHLVAGGRLDLSLFDPKDRSEGNEAALGSDLDRAACPSQLEKEASSPVLEKNSIAGKEIRPPDDIA